MSDHWLGALLVAVFVLGHIARAIFWFRGGVNRFWKTPGTLASVSKAALIGAVILAPFASIETAMPVATVLSMALFIAHLGTMGFMGRVDGS